MTLASAGPEVVAPDQGDLIDVLLGQHEQIRAGIAALPTAPPARRGGALRDLASLIEAHEDVESRFVHPLAEQAIPDGPAVAHARVVEENRADELLSQLIILGVDDAAFPTVYAEFRTIMLDHLHREEREEFTALRAAFSAEELREMGEHTRENRVWL